jgi:hypothetical protein
MIFTASKAQWKKILTAGALAVLVFAFSSSAVLAQVNPPSSGESGGSTSIGDVSIPVVGTFIKAILYVILGFIGLLISFVGFLTSAALNFNLTLLDFKPPFIVIGWTIFRDIANLGFVLGIIVIALGTILRYKGYTVQKMLPKLIASALVVNFSLLLGGVLIKISDFFSQYLLGFIGGGANAVAKTGDMFRFVKLMNSVSDWGLSDIGALVGIGPAASLYRLAAMLILIIFGVVMLMTLVGLCLTLFIRYFYLAFLLMIAPLAWLLWAFPSTSKHFTKWWDNFIKWVLQAPVILLFLYIALAVIDGYESYSANYNAQFQASQASLKHDGGSMDFGILMTSLIGTALLIGGLTMAQSLGYRGASMGISAFNKGKGWVKGKAQNARKNIRESAAARATVLKGKAKSSVLNSKFGTETQEMLKDLGSTKAGRMLGAGTAARGIERAKMQAEKESNAVVEREKGKLKDFSSDQIKGFFHTLNDNQKMAALDKMSAGDVKSVWGTLNENQRMAAVERVSSGDDLQTLFKDPAQFQSVLEGLNKRGRSKQSGDLEKKMGMNLAMLRALQGGGTTQVEKIDPQTQKPVIDPSTNAPVMETKTFEELRRDFHKSFSQADWKSFAKNAGNDIMSKKQHVFFQDSNNPYQSRAGMDTYSQEYNAEIFNSLAEDTPALGGTIAGTKPKNHRNLYLGVVDAIIKKYVATSTATGPILAVMAKMYDVPPTVRRSGRLKADIDIDVLAETLANSGDLKLKSIGKKIERSISGQMNASS